MRRIVIAAMLLMAGSAQAQAVFKCRDAKGQPIYQSEPCPNGRQAERIWVNEMRPPTPAERAARIQADRKIEEAGRRLSAANARNNRSVASNWSPTSSGESPQCLAARSEYERVQKDFVLNRNINLLRRLEANIYRYCKR